MFLWIPPEPSRPAEGGTTGFGENDGGAVAASVPLDSRHPSHPMSDGCADRDDENDGGGENDSKAPPALILTARGDVSRLISRFCRGSVRLRSDDVFKLDLMLASDAANPGDEYLIRCADETLKF